MHMDLCVFLQAGCSATLALAHQYYIHTPLNSDVISSATIKIFVSVAARSLRASVPVLVILGSQMGDLTRSCA